MASQQSLDAQLQAGIAAAKAGDKATARSLLEAVLKQDDQNELAWIWLASVVGSVRERRICLEKALQINPRNTRAREALNNLVGVSSTGELGKGIPGTLEPDRLTALPAAPRPFLRILGIGALVLIVLVIVSSLFTPRVTVGVLPTSTQLSAAAMVEVKTFTPVPAVTQPVIIVSPIFVTLPPTFTPTTTPSPTATLFPSPTAFPLAQYGVYYTSLEVGAAAPALYLVAADGTGDQRVLENVTDFTLDVTGEQIAFVREVTDTGAQLFIADINDLTNATQVTQIDKGSVGALAWSPDGNLIAFVSDYTGNDEIFVYDVTSNAVNQLIADPGSDRDPAWSPDGQTLLFSSDRESPLYYDLYLYRFDTASSVQRLTDDIGSSYAPQYNRDGTQIVYVNDRNGTADLILMAADGERQNTLVASPFEERSPIWSPDGRFVTFVSNREDDIFQLYSIEPPVRTITRLNRDGRQTGIARYRPDLILRLTP